MREIEQFLRGDLGFSSEETKNSSEVSFHSSEVSFHSSEVSFHSSEVLFRPSVENLRFLVSYWEIPQEISDFAKMYECRYRYDARLKPHLLELLSSVVSVVPRHNASALIITLGYYWDIML